MSSYSSPQRLGTGTGSASASPYGRGAAHAAGRQIVSPAPAHSQQEQGQGNYSPAHSPMNRNQGYGSPYGAQGSAQGSPYSTHQFQQSPTQSPSERARARAQEEAQAEIDAAAEEQRAVAEALAANKCICNICTCGKHHCPALIHGQAHYDPSLQSLYRQTYRRHPLEVTRAVAPPSTVFASGERFEGASVTRSDYVAHVGARPSPLWQPPPAETVRGEASLVKESETRANYKAHGFAKRSAAIPAHTMHVSNEPFDGQSTTKLDYQRWSARPPSPIRPTTNAAPSGPDERDFQTEASQHFNAKGYVARKPAIPFTSHVLGNDGEFDGESSMKSDYRQWDVKPSESFKPKYNPADLQPEDREFRTEKQANYTSKGSPGVVRMTAPPSQVLESAPFQGASVTRSDYVAHVGARPSPLWQPPPAETVRGEASLVKESETRANYKAHGFAKRSAAIPAHTMHVSNEPFDGQSTTKLDYQRWSARPPSPIRPTTNAAPNGPDERDFQTEASQHFNAKGYVARKPAIPFTSHVLGDHGHEGGIGESSMKADYRQWDARPAQSFKRDPKPVAPSLLYHA